MSLDDPSKHWEEKVKALHLANRNKAIERLKAEYGEEHQRTEAGPDEERGAPTGEVLQEGAVVRR